jgi:hypothetical protein
MTIHRKTTGRSSCGTHSISVVCGDPQLREADLVTKQNPISKCAILMQQPSTTVGLDISGGLGSPSQPAHLPSLLPESRLCGSLPEWPGGPVQVGEDRNC